MAISILSQAMPYLYSLDVSFCPNITLGSIATLLQIRGDVLAELSLHQCRSIYESLETVTRYNSEMRTAHTGVEPEFDHLIRALKSHGPRLCLSVLDLRYEAGHGSGYVTRNDYIFGELYRLGFQQQPRGYFSRPAVWNAIIASRLIEQTLP
jgi:hypothetical protein